MKYIDSLREGMRISEVYLCKSKQIAVTKTGKEYGRLMLQDKTGIVDAKIWNLNSPGVGTFEALDYVRIDGDVSVFMGANQLNVERIRKADEGEYLPENYLPVSGRGRKQYTEYRKNRMLQSQPSVYPAPAAADRRIRPCLLSARVLSENIRNIRKTAMPAG